MENFKIEGLSIKQLEALEIAVRQRREQLIFQDRKRVRDLLIQTAQDHGLSIYALFNLSPANQARRGKSDRRA